MTTTGISTATRTGIGDARGFYTVLGESPLTAHELAHRMGAHLEDVREWIVGQVKQGYVVHDPLTHRFSIRQNLPSPAQVSKIAA